MSEMLHVLRVFCDAEGEHGNPLGVFTDGAAIAPHRRQAVAAELGYSETVFVDDVERGELRIFTPAVELPFAGHPLVGTAWLLRRENPDLSMVRPPAGEVEVSEGDGLTWISARVDQAPDWDLLELESPAEVEALYGPPDGMGHVLVWAWMDESAGRVRTRAFAPDYGVREDEATGSASLRLCDHLGRALEIHQGVGSQIATRYAGSGRVLVGGRVVLDMRREGNH